MFYAIMVCYVLANAPDTPERCGVGLKIGDRENCIKAAANVPTTHQGRGYNRNVCAESATPWFGQWREIN